MSDPGDVARDDETIEPSGDQLAAVAGGLGAVPPHGDAQPTAYRDPAALDDDTLNEEGAP